MVKRVLALSFVVLFLLTPSVIAQLPPQQPRGLRMLVVSSRALSADLHVRLREGSSFDTLARQHSRDASAQDGGFVGAVSLADLRPDYRSALRSLEPGVVSEVIADGRDFTLLQWLTPDEEIWQQKNTLALEALGKDDLRHAATFFEEAVQAGERLKHQDYRLAQSLYGLGVIRTQQRRNAEAQKYFLRSLPLMREALGQRNPALIGNLSYLAETYRLNADYAGAEPLYREALEISETAFGANDESVATALNNLGLLYHLQKKFNQAAPLFERAVTIVEKAHGSDNPGLSTNLSNLAALYKDQGRYQDSRRLLERSIYISERAFGPGSPNVVPLIRALAGVQLALENNDGADALYRRLMALHWNSDRTNSSLEPGPEYFARVLNLAFFKDDKLEDALARLNDRITNDPPDEVFFAVLSRNLYSVELDVEAEKTMQRAVEIFPDSWYVRFEQGQLYAQMNRWKLALQAYQKAAAMSDPQSGPRIDIHQRGLIYREVARSHEELFQTEEAAAAYEQVLNLEPDNVDSLVGLGNVLLSTGKLDEAKARYTAAIVRDAVNVPAHQGLSEVHLRRGELDDARTAAERAILTDSKSRKARYLRATALFRSGRNAEAERELEVYRQLEAAERQEENNRRDIAVINQTATSLLAKDPAGSIALFQRGIQSHPEAGTLRLNLGIAQHRLGNHQAALQAFTSALGLKLDDHFLVQLGLADEYQELQNRNAEKRHHSLYLQEYEAALSANRAN